VDDGSTSGVGATIQILLLAAGGFALEVVSSGGDDDGGTHEERAGWSIVLDFFDSIWLRFVEAAFQR